MPGTRRECNMFCYGQLYLGTEYTPSSVFCPVYVVPCMWSPVLGRYQVLSSTDTVDRQGSVDGPCSRGDGAMVPWCEGAQAPWF